MTPARHPEAPVDKVPASPNQGAKPAPPPDSWPACLDVRDRQGRCVGRLWAEVEPTTRVVVVRNWQPLPWGSDPAPIEIRLPLQTRTAVERRVVAGGYGSICWFERDFVEHHASLLWLTAFEPVTPQDDPLLLEVLAWRRITLAEMIIASPDRIGR